MSHSLRSAWIEINLFYLRATLGATVALLTECVDRNCSYCRLICSEWPVALLTECVDRNCLRVPASTEHFKSHSLRSAWIEISLTSAILPFIFRSHSLRSAWIEMYYEAGKRMPAPESHSLRSAWIEIWNVPLASMKPVVALLTECVDRNIGTLSAVIMLFGVALLTECVDRNCCYGRRGKKKRRRTPYGVRG